MPPSCRPPSPLRCAQALCCSLAFGTAAAAGPWLPSEGDGCMAAWTLSFSLTLLLLLLLAETFSRVPPTRPDLPLLHSAAASMACASAAIIWPLGHLRGSQGSPQRPRALRATAAAASCLAALFYLTEILRNRPKPGHPSPYLATPPGLLKVVETFLALLLLSLAAEQGASGGSEGWKWCLGIYCVSFALGVLVLGGFLWGWGCWAWGRDPERLRRGLGVYAALGVVGYGAAAVLWPLYAFNQEMGGIPRRPPGCGPSCPWDRWVLVALLSAINLLVYGVDLGQTGRLVLLRA